MKRIAAALAISFFGAVAPAAAVELCAALDGSGSLSPAEFQLQLEGLAGAVEDPSIIPRDGSATLSAVVFEWGASVAVPATAIDGEASAAAFAAAVRAIPWRFGHRTDMVAAIQSCSGQFRDAADRWVIDISTDGRHSQTLGTDPLSARDDAVAAGLDVLNALGVGAADLDFLGTLVWPQPAAAFPGDGFVVAVPDFSAYVNAMREKIRAEVAREVAIDVKPGSCPNPFNLDSRGALPVAVLGSADFDVSSVDPSTLRLEGVAPLRWAHEDVAAPAEGRKGSCSSCTTKGRDGHPDLVLHFDRAAFAAALGSAGDGACLLVTLSGNLTAAAGGGPIRGSDVLRVIRK